MTAAQVDRVRAQARRLGIDVGETQVRLLGNLLARVLKESQNLTSVTSFDAGIDTHIVDSLSGLVAVDVQIAPLLVDIGSGGGFPGLVLATLRPECAVTLVESERKKADWLEREAALLPNVRVVADRTETLATTEREAWPLVTARAVAPYPVVLELAAPLLAIGGALVVWRGDRVGDEAGLAQSCEHLGLERESIIPVEPFAGARRALHVFRKHASTPDRYPRRPGMATKRPLV